MFTRYAVDKPLATKSNPEPQSYEFSVGVEIVKDLTHPDLPYNIVMETTGQSPGLVKFGLAAPHYAVYSKLVILSEIDDVDKAKLITYSRLIRELNEWQIHGGEQFGSFLEVIDAKAKKTYTECVNVCQQRNKQLDDADNSIAGRWYFSKLLQNCQVPTECMDSIKQFYDARSA